MKKMILISLVIFFSISIYAQEIRQRAICIQAPVLADFENPENTKLWKIGDTSPNCDMEKTGIKPVEGGPINLPEPPERKKWTLGVKTAFKSRGYNYIEILPPVYDPKLYPDIQPLFLDGIPNPNNERFIPIPGKCKTIDVWVAGRNYRYTLEICLKDYNGFVYALEMGKIDYAGWRDLSREIPYYIPQEQKYLPPEKPLKFLKFVLRADPDEVADKLYVYFDHLKVVTDVYMLRYDGYDIKDNW